VAAPGRLAVAFELSRDVQRVSGQRVDATTFEITASATGTAIDGQEWRAPSDVQLVKHVSVVSDPRGTHELTARVTVAENTRARVRLEGRRIYVDVSRAQLEFDERGDSATARVGGPPATRAQGPAARAQGNTAPHGTASAAAETDSTQDAHYREAMAPVFARYEEIQPFLRSAVATPTPEVLAAVSGTFAELEHTLETTNVPRAVLAPHGLLTSAVQLAKSAVQPTFNGDRVSQVREANAQFQAAKAQLR